MKIASIVFSRNDGLKDDKRCLMHFLSSIETFDEVIYIDWNSDVDKGSLLWKLAPHIPKTGKIKHIVIPPEIVKQLTPNPDAFQVNETITRNIGMRRTDCDWIVNTNIDIIPPPRKALEDFINNGDKDTFYTISRREAPLSVFEKYQAEQWAEFYEELSRTIEPRYYPAKVSPNDEYSLINCCGDFQLAHRDVWYKVRGFEEEMYRFCFIDTNVQKKAVLSGYNLQAAYEPPLFHIEHSAYKINEKGEKEEAKEWNEGNLVDKYNDVWSFVEFFTSTGNNEDWGLGNIEIEYETH